MNGDGTIVPGHWVARIWSLSCMSRGCRLTPLFILLAIVVSSCGFQPLYGPRGTGSEVLKVLSVIKIEPIGGRLGQYLHNQLLDLLSPTGVPPKPVYRLVVKLHETRTPFGIARDESVSRYTLSLRMDFVLYPIGKKRPIDKGFVRAVASYNVIRVDYASLVAERDAQKRATRQLAQDLRVRLALFLVTAGPVTVKSDLKSALKAAKP